MATSKIHKSLLVAESGTAEQVSIAANTSTAVTITPPRIEGHTAVGIVGIRKNGGSNNFVAVSGFYLNADNDAYIGLVNASNATRTVGVYVKFLYD